MKESVVAGRFIRTLKSKIFKYITSMSKNVYIDKVEDITNKQNNTINNTIRKTIKINPANLKSRKYY